MIFHDFSSGNNKYWNSTIFHDFKGVQDPSNLISNYYINNQTCISHLQFMLALDRHNGIAYKIYKYKYTNTHVHAYINKSNEAAFEVLWLTNDIKE